LVPALAAALLVSLWVAIKVRLFLGLEYSWDLFDAIQLSRSWLIGRPFLWENRWGAQAVSHNNYLTPLLGALTLPWGAYGLFVGHAGLLLLAFLELDRVLRPLPVGRRLAWAVAYLFGPVGFWIWDDPFYGWHAELLFVPLSVLFAGALQRRSRLAALWATLLVLVREDGAVVACSIHLLLRAWADGASPPRSREALVRSLKIASGWLLIFALGLASQRWARPLAADRLTAALSSLGRLAAEPRALAALARDTAGALLLLGSGLLLVARPLRGAALAASVPLLAVAVVGTLAYDLEGMASHGPTWACRFALLWGVLAGAVAASPGRDEVFRVSGPRTAFFWSIAGSVAAQGALLILLKAYDPVKRVAQALPGRDDVQAMRLSAIERAFLACVSEALPAETSVAVHVRLFGYFHRHDLVWPSYVENAWRAPQAVVCEPGQRLPRDRGCPRLHATLVRRGFLQKSVEGISVAYEPGLASHLAPCGGAP
jgi:hypothetical protein